MADNTNLSLGPNATIKLDRTVFNDEHSYRAIAIRLTTGAFRFVTGNSEKAAYKITTTVATIGVRGTILDILSQKGKTTVVLQEGISRVCAVGGACVELTHPGDTAVIILTGGKLTIQKFNTRPGVSPQTASHCLGSAPSRNTPMPHHRPLTMTAAIPPACCAGADDGKIQEKLGNSSRTGSGGAFACADRSKYHPVIRTMRWPLPITITITLPDAKPYPHAFTDANRREFERRVDQWPRQPALQPVDHQSGARQRASGRQRTDQLQRLH